MSGLFLSRCSLRYCANSAGGSDIPNQTAAFEEMRLVADASYLVVALRYKLRRGPCNKTQLHRLVLFTTKRQNTSCKSAEAAQHRRRPLVPRTLLEISQIRRRLILARGHQVTVATDEIVLAADLNMCVTLTEKFRPDRLRIRIA
jgi:hypothetical protein